jgi:hypothetical protein
MLLMEAHAYPLSPPSQSGKFLCSMNGFIEFVPWGAPSPINSIGRGGALLHCLLCSAT